MPRSDQLIRQWKILKFLEANGRATLRRLESELDGACHERTLRRDLEALSLTGIPLRDERENGKTYWVLDEAYKRFSIPLTGTELFALLCGRELLRPLEGTFLAESLDQLYRKAHAALTPDQRETFNLLQQSLTLGASPHGTYGDRQEIIRRLHSAIEQGRVVEMDYASASSRSGPRKVNPYRLHYQNGVLYLIAHCHRRREVRTFAVDRIRSVEMTDRTFQWPLYFDVQDYFKGAFGVYRGKAEEITLVFEKEAARWVKGRKWHASQEIQILKGGKIRMNLRTAVTPELLQWVLGFGPKVLVEQPAHLARMVRNAAWKLLGRYEGTGEKGGRKSRMGVKSPGVGNRRRGG